MSAVSFGNVCGKDFEEQASALVAIGALVLFCTCVQMDLLFFLCVFFLFSEKNEARAIRCSKVFTLVMCCNKMSFGYLDMLRLRK